MGRKVQPLVVHDGRLWALYKATLYTGMVGFTKVNAIYRVKDTINAKNG